MKKLLLLSLLAVIAQISAATAQAYPTRPITIIVPYPAGGPSDALARLLAESMKVSLGQTIIVENVSGGAGNIGVGRTVRAAPNGYTLGIGQVATHVLNPALYALPYNVLEDLEPVALLSSNPFIILSRTGVPAKNLPELIAWLRQNPDTATAAAIGASSELPYFYFQSNTGTRLRLIPYRGAAPAMQDLVAGHVDLYFTGASTVLAQVDAGQVRAHGVLAKTRWFAAPDVPTLGEIGLPELDYAFWHGLWAPKGTPKDIIDKLNSAVAMAFADPAIRRRIAELGQEIPSPELQTPEALGAYHRAEIEKWWPVIKAANIKAN